MQPRPPILVPRPIVEQLSDRRFRARSAAFPGLDTVERTADAADFVLRLLIQKRLYGQPWAWAAAR